MTRKELIERGYIDQYVLGLTTDDESAEVERMANLFPEIQEQINSARHRLCSSFNRNLTKPVLANSALTKRRVIIWSGVIISLFCISFFLLCHRHYLLQEEYTQQREQLAREHARVTELASFSKMASEEANFLHAPGTQRIKLKGCDNYPEAEVMIFHCENTGRMKLRVIDLPSVAPGQHYEVWGHQPGHEDLLLGTLIPPVRFDTLYSLEPLRDCDVLEIHSVDPYTMRSSRVCMASLQK